MYNAMKNMGMALYFPPDVSGWNIGPAWITTATKVERIGWADTLFGGKGAKQGRLGFNVEPLFDQDPSAKGIATKLCSVFDVQLPPNKVATLVAAAEQATQGMLNTGNSSKTAIAVSRLIFASPEFQMM
jgi:uncharacterized protein (DUF1800 family)